MALSSNASALYIKIKSADESAGGSGRNKRRASHLHQARQRIMRMAGLNKKIPGTRAAILSSLMPNSQSGNILRGLAMAV